eukprot:COSAG01_NODE_2519_length_7522_cov_6.051192_1_plen_1559_part_10
MTGFMHAGGQFEALDLEVYDWDLMSKDDAMGKASLKVSLMKDQDIWLTLQPMPGCEDPHGEILLHCSVASWGQMTKKNDGQGGKRRRGLTIQTTSSRQVEAMQERASKVKEKEMNVRRKAKLTALSLIQHPAFDYFIITCVILNTIFLSMEYHGQGDEWTAFLLTTERVFLTVFVLEALLKWLGLGVHTYFSLPSNRFDFFLVTVSSVEQVMLVTSSGSALGPISVLRCFRLLRVIRAMRSIGELRVVIELIMQSSQSVMDCFVFVLFVLVIFALLGMQLFAEEDGAGFNKTRFGQHFGTFSSSMLLLFQVLTGEDWVALLEMGMSRTHLAAPYFVTYYILVVYVLLNIFVALIMDAFSVHDDIKTERQGEQFLREYGRIAAHNQLREQGMKLKGKEKKQTNLVHSMVDDSAFKHTKLQVEKLLPRKLSAATTAIASMSLEEKARLATDASKALQFGNTSATVVTTQNSNQRSRQSSAVYSDETHLGTRKLHVRGVGMMDEQQLSTTFTQFGDVSQVTVRKRFSEDGTNTSWALVTMSQPAAVQKALKSFEKIGRIEGSPGLSVRQFDEGQAAKSTGAMSTIQHEAGSKVAKYDKFAHTVKEVVELTFNPSKCDEFEAMEARVSKQNQSREVKDCLKHALQRCGLYDCLLRIRRVSKTFARAVVSFKCPIPFSSKHCYLFDVVIYTAIVANMVFLAMDKPGLEPRSQLARVISIADTVFMVIFSTEFVLKMLAMGAISPGGYLRETWNVFDALLLVIMYFDYFISSFGTSPGRALRSLRCLRPLRMINANESMKLVMNLFVRSFPKIFHVIMLTLVFFLISAVLGINLFSGLMHRCSDGSVWGQPDCVGSIVTSCEIGLRQWTLPVNNFDDVGSGFVTLYEVATLEGWVEVMHNTMDAADEVGRQPQRDAAPSNALFFVVFISFGSFFVMNLLVAVYIDSFNQSRGTGLMTAEQIGWVEIKRLMYRIKPRRVQLMPQSKCRRRLHTLVTARSCIECASVRNGGVVLEESDGAHKALEDQTSVFDKVMIVVIMLNSVALSCVWAGQSEQSKQTMRYVDFVFVVAYCFEVIAKVGGLGYRAYFRGYWNQFDFIIVAFSIMDLTPIHDHVDTSIFQTMRLLRMLKLVRRMQGLRALVQTLFVSLPAIFNLAALLLIVFFVYAVMGVQLFSTAQHGSYLNEDANFENFFKAMFLLLRVTTGEAWNGIMHDLELGGDGTMGQPSTSKKYAARAYFISFYTVTAFVFMKLFIAVILDNFAHCFSREGHSIEPRVLAEYRRVWYKFDKTGKGVIPTNQLRRFVQELPPPLGQVHWPRVQLEALYSGVIERSRQARVAPNFVCFYQLLHTLTLRRVGLPALEYQERVHIFLDEQLTRQKVAATIIGSAIRGKLARKWAAAAKNSGDGGTARTPKLRTLEFAKIAQSARQVHPMAASVAKAKATQAPPRPPDRGASSVTPAATPQLLRRNPASNNAAAAKLAATKAAAQLAQSMAWFALDLGAAIEWDTASKANLLSPSACYSAASMADQLAQDQTRSKPRKIAGSQHRERFARTSSPSLLQQPSTAQ